MEYTFKILHFDVRNIKHEDFADTVKRIRGGKGPKKPLAASSAIGRIYKRGA